LQKKLNVLFVLNNMGIGGSQTYTLTLAEELKAHGNNVIIMSWGGILEEKLKKIGLKHSKLPFNRLFDLYVYLRTVPSSTKKILYYPLAPLFLCCFVLAFLRIVTVAKKEHINIINSTQPIPTSLALLASRFLQIPVVVTVHGLDTSEFPPYGHRYLNRYVHMIDRIAKIITVSEEIKLNLTNRVAVEQRQVIVIPNGVRVSRYLSSNPQVEKIDNNVLFISGTTHFVVATELMLAVPAIITHLPDCKVTIIGGGKNPQAIAKAEEINKEITTDVITVIGSCPYDDIPNVIRQSKVVIGVGRSVLEAVASGKPVIVAGAQGFGGILTKEDFLRLKLHNFSGRGTDEKSTKENLAIAILKVLEDGEFRHSLEAFSRTIAKDFDVENIAKQIEALYYEEVGI